MNGFLLNLTAGKVTDASPANKIFMDCLVWML